MATKRGLAIIISLLVAACSPEPHQKLNVVLISVDTLRADRLGCYGATQVETPAIDALARSGVRFENAYTPVPLTLPAHWTIFTGLQPWHHGVVDNGMTLAAPPAATLAERLTREGYDTAAFVSAFVLHRTFGLSRGFARYDDGPASDSALDQVVHANGSADGRVDQALAWLRRERAQPFFLWLHLFDPHAPYTPPEGFRERYADRPYDGEVAFVDSQVARVLTALNRSGIADQTLVVLVSDHGESLGEHGERTHGVLLYDATLRVPFILRLPGKLDGGLVRRDEATLADVAPTILALTGVGGISGLDGRDLFGGDTSPRRLPAISEAPARRLGWARMVAVRDNSWKYIASPRPELFELSSDPGELKNVIDVRGDRVTSLARSAHEIERALQAELMKQSTNGPTREDRARLSALGYVSNTAKRSGAPPDPKDVISEMDALDLGYQLFAEGHFAEAETRLRALLKDSGSPSAPVLLGLARLSRLRGKPAEAESFYLRLLGQDQESAVALAQLVTLAGERGDSRLAVERARRLASLVPKDAGASRLLAEALSAAGASQAAETEWRRGLAEAPDSGWLRLSFARFLIAGKREREAQKELDRIMQEEALPEDLLAQARALRASFPPA